jgi:methylthioribulose-1-phosphate dehydratase
MTTKYDASILGHYDHQIEGLRTVGQQMWTRGWSLGTSSNYSVVVQDDPKHLLVTASGMDKGHLKPCDFVVVDGSGHPISPDQPKSSAETLLHCVAVEMGAGAVLHTHSPWATVLSEHFAAQHGMEIANFEMLKGLQGITTHESRIWLPVFENTQNIPELAAEVRAYAADPKNPPLYGYLIRRHGMYTWGKTLADATRHIEVLEFLLECVGRQISLR